MAAEVKGNVTILPPPKDEDELVGSGESWPRARINPAMLDMTMVGKPIQCPEETCETLKNVFEWRKYLTVQEAARYKYIIDVSVLSF